MANHWAIFKADKYSKAYYLWHEWHNYKKFEIRETNGEFIESVVIWEGFLDSPHLKPHEEVYVAELDTVVKVWSSMRSTDGSVIYQTDYEVERVEDENTEESRLVAEKKLKETEIYITHQEKIEEEKRNRPLEVEKNWWQKLIFRIKS